MHLPNIFKHNKEETKPVAKEEEKKAQEHHHQHHHQRDDPNLPKGFANDAMRASSKPDTLYGFDDPMARRLGPVPSVDPTNTGA